MVERKRRAIKIHKEDNVAVCLEDVVEGDIVSYNEGEVKALENIPYGHKIAIKDIKKGGFIIKYGEVIGRVTEFIKRGSHVHVHNVESLRGRGDLK